MILGREFIVSELEKLSVNKKITNTSIAICCPFHKERNPSCHISVEEGSKVPLGTFHCFGCNKSGGWNIIAQQLGLKLLPKNGEDKEDSSLLGRHIKSKVENISDEEDTTPKFSDLVTFGKWEGDWIRKNKEKALNKTYRYKFLKQFNPLCYYDFKFGKNRIVFTVTIFGEPIGYAIEGNGDGYHKFSKGKWIRRALFPLDNISGNVAVLVEGVSDALALLEQGIPAICFMGVENWNQYKSNLLAAKGIEIVCVVCDGDEQGYECNRRIVEDLENKFDVRMLDLPRIKPRMDPEMAPKRIVRVIKNMCKP